MGIEASGVMVVMTAIVVLAAISSILFIAIQTLETIMLRRSAPFRSRD